MENIVFLISDSARNMRKLSQDNNWEHARCLIHMIHNVVHHVLAFLREKPVEIPEDEEKDRDYIGS